MKYTENIVVGNPIVEPSELFALDADDWEAVERNKTAHTNERFLPAILKEFGIVDSTSEVRRNKPQLCRTLDALDFFEVKWGKKRLFILVGE